MKTEEKFDRLLEDIAEIKETQVHMRADLQYHIKRTDLLEGFMKSQIKVLLGIITAVLAALSVSFFNNTYASVEPIEVSLTKLQSAVPCTITLHSWKRTPEHNRRVGGAPNSYHLKARAMDISARCMSHRELAQIARKYVNGVILYKSHVHIDNRPYKFYKEK